MFNNELYEIKSLTVIVWYFLLIFARKQVNVLLKCELMWFITEGRQWQMLDRKFNFDLMTVIQTIKTNIIDYAKTVISFELNDVVLNLVISTPTPARR